MLTVRFPTDSLSFIVNKFEHGRGGGYLVKRLPCTRGQGQAQGGGGAGAGALTET